MSSTSRLRSGRFPLTAPKTARLEALVARRRLKLEDKGKPGKVAAAVEYLVDDWTKDKLVPKGDAQQD